ncbi:MAG: glucose/galactose MFS transporter [Sphingobacteriales bacterium 50-39]|nr:sugar MFS transporter [Sphingobacteriales bacterium]OJW60968.1 MAG: glucose/galactose MFS transporter [Sphingobacteriales bacterium 50-39]
MKYLRQPIFIIGILFSVFGLVTWLNSVLIPYLRIACQLNNFSSYLVAFSLYISYTVMALPAAAVLKRTGYKNGMALGLFIMTVGTLCFIPAAMSRMYALFLFGLFIQGTGMAILQTAANPYVTILGPMESAARRMSIMGICNGVAGVIGPLVLGSVILNDADGIRERVAHMAPSEKAIVLEQLAHRAIVPYAIIALALLGLGAWVYYSGLPEAHEEEDETSQTNEHHRKTSIFQFPHLLLGVLTLFLYVGVEVIAGDTIISYGTSLGFRLSTARFFNSYTLAGMLAGYLLGIVLIPKYLSHTKVLKISSLMGLVFGLAALFTRGGVSVTFVALLGLANSMVWPSIWPLAIRGLGRFTRVGSSLLILAIGGGALLPLLYGWLADHFSPQEAYWIVVPCYCFIGYYAVRGHKVRV